MTERIKELARQAGLTAPYGSDREGLRDFSYREFAQLIIFECSKLAVFRGDLDTAQAIKEHFEVDL